MINLNKLASKVTLIEGGKKSTNVANVKEVMKILFTELSKLNILQIAEVLKRYKK